MKTGADCVFFHACFCFCAFLVTQAAKYSRKCSLNQEYAARRGICISTLHNINVLNCVTITIARYMYIFEIEKLTIACVVNNCVGVWSAVMVHTLDIANGITTSFKRFILLFLVFK